MNRMHTSVVVISLFLASVPSALANTTWYVNGATGTDVNDCLSATTPCKTIGHAISLALSGDSISVDAGTYTENLIIGKNLNILGSSAVTTMIDGGALGLSSQFPAQLPSYFQALPFATVLRQKAGVSTTLERWQLTSAL